MCVCTIKHNCKNVHTETETGQHIVMRNIALADYRAQKDEKTLNQTMKSLKTFVDANVRNSRTWRMMICCIFYTVAFL